MRGFPPQSLVQALPYDLIFRPQHSLLHGLFELVADVVLRRPFFVRAAVCEDFVDAVELREEGFWQDNPSLFDVDDDFHVFPSFLFANR